MVTNVQQTSIDAYLTLDNIHGRREAVYRTILKLGTACNQAVADHLQLPVNQVTGRVFELRDKGLVAEAFKAPWEPTGKRVIWWKAK